MGEGQVDIGPGYRTYYVQPGAVLIVLLTGGDKRTQEQDIELALATARQLE